jgi:hypothetical protein
VYESLGRVGNLPFRYGANIEKLIKYGILPVLLSNAAMFG